MKDKLVFFIFIAVIVTFSLIPRNTPQMEFLHRLSLTESGFFQHLAGYLIASVAAFRAFPRKRALICLAGLFALSIGLEMLQAATATRTFNPTDILANTLGIAPVALTLLFSRAGAAKSV